MKRQHRNPRSFHRLTRFGTNHQPIRTSPGLFRPGTPPSSRGPVLVCPLDPRRRPRRQSTPSSGRKIRLSFPRFLAPGLRWWSWVGGTGVSPDFRHRLQRQCYHLPRLRCRHRLQRQCRHRTKRPLGPRPARLLPPGRQWRTELRHEKGLRSATTRMIAGLAATGTAMRRTRHQQLQTKQERHHRRRRRRGSNKRKRLGTAVPARTTHLVVVQSRLGQVGHRKPSQDANTTVIPTTKAKNPDASCSDQRRRCSHRHGKS